MLHVECTLSVLETGIGIPKFFYIYEPGNFEKLETQKRDEKTNSPDEQNHRGSLTTAKSPTQTRTPRKRKGKEREKGRRKKPSTRDQPGQQPREERETRNPKPQSRISNPEYRIQKPESRSRNPESRNQNLEAKDSKRKIPSERKLKIQISSL